MSVCKKKSRQNGCLGDDTCPLCLANRKKRSNIKGHRYYTETRIRTNHYGDNAMKKIEQTKAATGTSGTVTPSGFTAKHPLVLSYLRDDTYDGGEPRERSTLTVFVEGCVVKVALNDRDAHRSLYVCGETFEAALKALEAAVESQGADWRAWSGTKRKK